jgi:hypothetical protein
METGDYVLTESNDKIILESTTNNSVLMESGSYVLLESGDRIVLEAAFTVPELETALRDTDGELLLDTLGNIIYGV